MDRGRQPQSKGARGTLLEQLQTMHQPLSTPEQSEASSRPAQASEGNGASLMQLMSTMARKPHWQKGKLGECTQPGFSKHAPLFASKQPHPMTRNRVYAC